MINVITEDSTTALDVIDGEKAIILRDVVFNVPGNFALSLSGLLGLLRNFGTIIGQDRYGVVADGGNIRLDNADTGEIRGEYVGISAELGNSAISNSGLISASYAAIELKSSQAVTITNNGTLQGDYNGVIIADGTIDTRLNNYDTIQTIKPGSIGVSIDDTSFGTKIYNLGTILSQAFGIRNDGFGSNLHNRGDIIAAIGVETAGDARFVNDGTITATIAAIIVTGDAFNANVTNRGTLNGDVIFAGGDDRFGNQADIVGDIDMGAGSDKVTNSGTIDGLISLADGRDLYNGSKALSGSTVDGGAGRDDLRGGDFADQLSGGDDMDVLRAGDGDDVLTGGGDRDVLTGGGGADTFVYREAADSGEIFDVITDFTSGEDKLDLTDLYAGAFVIGEDGLVGDGTASVHADVKSNNNAFINVDIDGDGYRDMLILLQRAGELADADFIL